MITCARHDNNVISSWNINSLWHVVQNSQVILLYEKGAHGGKWCDKFFMALLQRIKGCIFKIHVHFIANSSAQLLQAKQVL